MTQSCGTATNGIMQLNANTVNRDRLVSCCPLGGLWSSYCTYGRSMQPETHPGLTARDHGSCLIHTRVTIHTRSPVAAQSVKSYHQPLYLYIYQTVRVINWSLMETDDVLNLGWVPFPRNSFPRGAFPRSSFPRRPLRRRSPQRAALPRSALWRTAP